MKIFDCITYFDEPMMFDLRLKILNESVDEFIVCEALYTHSGEKKKINFNKKLYPEFKNRITHLVVEEEPENLVPLEKNNNSLKYKELNRYSFRLNASKRIQKQRDAILNNFDEDNYNDWIIYSDSDEIPNLSKINLKKIKNKIVIFKQNFFYYKFNLIYPNYDWYGSKAIKFKDIENISTLRNSKNKKYPWWRIDTIINKYKYMNLKIIEDGGWHFTELKTPKEIFIKHKNDEHHDEFDLTGINESDIEKMISEKRIPYNHFLDKNEIKSKWNKSNKFYLEVANPKILPKQVIENKDFYKNWLV